jgi:hypothetical protein
MPKLAIQHIPKLFRFLQTFNNFQLHYINVIFYNFLSLKWSFLNAFYHKISTFIFGSHLRGFWQWGYSNLWIVFL